MKKFAVIVAAGAGHRMNSDIPKQFLLANGKPVLWHTLKVFLNAYDDMRIILVLHERQIDAGKAIVHSLGAEKRILITSGGDTRFDSVKKGLQIVEQPSVIFVHDGVRCLVTEKLIQNCYEQTMIHGNAIPCVKSVDSLRLDTGTVSKVLDRNKVYIIQTPQTFLSEIIVPSFAKENEDSFTDEATVAESIGVKINLIEGEANNIKITRPLDLIIAESVLKMHGTQNE